ncbi:hypothetical protein SEVIR_5G457650v4 [Setaria viridis]
MVRRVRLSRRIDRAPSCQPAAPGTGTPKGAYTGGDGSRHAACVCPAPFPESRALTVLDMPAIDGTFVFIASRHRRASHGWTWTTHFVLHSSNSRRSCMPCFLSAMQGPGARAARPKDKRARRACRCDAWALATTEWLLHLHKSRKDGRHIPVHQSASRCDAPRRLRSFICGRFMYMMHAQVLHAR